MLFRQRVEQLSAMVLAVWDLEVVQERDLDVNVPQLTRFFSEFGDQLKDFLLVPSIRRKLFNQSLDPAAVGAEAVHIFRSNALRKSPDGAVHSFEDKPALILQSALVEMIID